MASSITENAFPTYSPTSSTHHTTTVKRILHHCNPNSQRHSPDVSHGPHQKRLETAVHTNEVPPTEPTAQAPRHGFGTSKVVTAAIESSAPSLQNSSSADAFHVHYSVVHRTIVHEQRSYIASSASQLHECSNKEYEPSPTPSQHARPPEPVLVQQSVPGSKLPSRKQEPFVGAYTNDTQRKHNVGTEVIDSKRRSNHSQEAALHSGYHPAMETTPAPKRHRAPGAEKSYGQRSYQHDRYILEDVRVPLGAHRNRTATMRVAGVFDGHGEGQVGHLVSEFCENHFIPSFQGSREAWDNVRQPDDVSEILQAISHALELTIADMEKRGTEYASSMSSNSHAGTTACIAVLLQGHGRDADDLLPGKWTHVITANVGDSRAVLGIGSWTSSKLKEKAITSDQTPERPDERARIYKAGGWVTKNNMLNGYIGMSRGLGDKDMKELRNQTRFHPRPRYEEAPPKFKDGKRFADTLFISTPELQTIPLGMDGDQSQAQFCIVATDGVWHGLSNRDAVDVVHNALKKGNAPAKCAKRLVQTAIARHVQDNITAIIIPLTEDAAPLVKNSLPLFGKKLGSGRGSRQQQANHGIPQALSSGKFSLCTVSNVQAIEAGTISDHLPARITVASGSASATTSVSATQSVYLSQETYANTSRPILTALSSSTSHTRTTLLVDDAEATLRRAHTDVFQSSMTQTSTTTTTHSITNSSSSSSTPSGSETLYSPLQYGRPPDATGLPSQQPTHGKWSRVKNKIRTRRRGGTTDETLDDQTVHAGVHYGNQSHQRNLYDDQTLHPVAAPQQDKKENNT